MTAVATVTTKTAALAPASAPVRPRSFLQQGTIGMTLIATFETRDAAAEAALDLVASARPLSVDLLDRAAVHAVSRFADVDPLWETGAVLAITLDADLSSDELPELGRLCSRNGATTVQISTDESATRAVATIVRSARLALAMAGTGLPYDVTVPVSQLPRLLRSLDAIEARFGISIGLVAHAGDGIVAPFVVGNSADSEAALVAVAALALTIELTPFA